MARLKIADLLPGTDYVVQVRALRDGEPSKWSEKFEFTAIENSVIPKTPENVTWVAMDKHFKGEWDKVNRQVDEDFAKIIRYDVELEKPDGTLREVIAHPASDEPRQKFKLGEQKMQSIFGQILTSVKFRVRAVSQNENKSAWSAPITAGIGAPNPPTNLTITPGPLTLKLEWTPPADTTNLDGYRVYSGSTAGFTPVRPAYQGAATTYTFNATSFDVHYFKVCSYSRHGLESSYVSISGTPGSLIDSQPPDEPSGINGSITNSPDNKSATATVNWTLATVPADLGGFNIRFRKVGQTYWDMASTDAAARTVSFEVTPFVDYEVSLQSLDENANGSAWTTPFLINGVVNTPPATVTGLVSVPSRESIKYSWTASADADVANQAGHYELQVSTSNAFPGGSTTTYITGYETYDALGLVPNTTHYARVRAVDSGGMTGAAWSSVDTETTLSFPITPPSDGNAPASSPTPVVTPGIGYLHASWTAITNADVVTYEVHISTTTGFTPTSGTKAAEIMGTSVVLEKDGAGVALAYGTPYYVKIVAKDADGLGPAGAQASGTPIKAASTDIESVSFGQVTTGTLSTGTLTISPGGIIKTAGNEVQVTGSGIIVTGANSSIQADSITSGDFTAGKTLNVKGTMKVATGGWIESEDFGPSGGATGYRLTNNSLTIKNGSVSAGALTTGSIAGGAAITITGSSYIDVASGFIRGGGYTGTTHSSNPSGVGWFIGSGGINIPGGSILIPAGNITTGNVSSATIQITGSGSIYGSGWSLGSGGLQVTSAAGSTSIVGDAIKTGAIKSSNYQPGVDGAGWSINTSGSVEFNTGTFRGTIYASGGTFAGTVDIGPANDRVQIRNSGTVGIIDFWDGGGVSGSLYGFGSGIYVTGTLQGTLFSPNNITLQSGGTVRTNYLGSTTSLLVIQDQVQINAKLVMNSTAIEGVSNILSGGAQFSGAIHLNNNNINSVAQITVATVAGDPTISTLTAASGGERYVVTGNGGKLGRGLATSSAAKYKTDISNLGLDLDAARRLPARQFVHIGDEHVGLQSGFVADEAHALGLTKWVGYNDEGGIEKFHYDRWTAAQQIMIQHLWDKLDEQSEQIEDLLKRLTDLEN